LLAKGTVTSKRVLFARQLALYSRYEAAGVSYWIEYSTGMGNGKRKDQSLSCDFVLLLLAVNVGRHGIVLWAHRLLLTDSRLILPG